MKTALALLVFAGACSMGPSAVDTLPHDTYYSRDDSAQCSPNIPAQWCMPKLSLCANGSYAFLLGDVETEGTYYLDGPTAVASGTNGYGSFTFDLPSRVMDGDGGAGPAPWTVETFVGDVDCTYNAP